MILMVTIKELETNLFQCEKIVTRLKAEISELEGHTHPELNKVYCALIKILKGNDEQ